ADGERVRLVRETVRRERLLRWASRHVPGGHPGVDPPHERVDLLVRETQVVTEGTPYGAVLVVERAPRRHLARGDLRLRELAHRLHLLVGGEGERGDAVGAMAALALLLDERLDVL